jgi:hypothetical protein
LEFRIWKRGIRKMRKKGEIRGEGEEKRFFAEFILSTPKDSRILPAGRIDRRLTK